MSSVVTTNRPATFLSVFAAAVVTCLSAAGLLNYYVDPANLFDSSHSLERTAASLLTTGNVGGMTNYDERLLQKYRLEIEPVVPRDFVIVGSSRSMQVSSVILHGNSLNLSVSGASIEDDVAILDMAAKIPTRIVVLEGSPWLFNVNNDQGRWRSLALEYAGGLKNLGYVRDGTSQEGAGVTSRLSQLLNSAYTVASLQTLLKSLEGPKQSKPFLKRDDSPETMSDVIRRDGSRVNSSKLADRSPEETRRNALLEGDPPIYSLNRYVRVDPTRLAIFRSLIRRLKQRSEVWLFLPPYYPDTYEKIARNVPIIREVEDTLRSLAREANVRALGSFDSRKVGCTDVEFFDGMHPKDGCIRRIFPE